MLGRLVVNRSAGLLGRIGRVCSPGGGHRLAGRGISGIWVLRCACGVSLRGGHSAGLLIYRCLIYRVTGLRRMGCRRYLGGRVDSLALECRLYRRRCRLVWLRRGRLVLLGCRLCRWGCPGSFGGGTVWALGRALGKLRSAHITKHESTSGLSKFAGVNRLNAAMGCIYQAQHVAC